MKCYFLNVRRFVSKAGKDCCLLTVTDSSGQVSEFFISPDLFEQLDGNYRPFNFIDVEISVSRGRVSVFNVEPCAVTSDN